MKPKTQAEYLKSYSRCPVCNRSDGIEGQSLDIDFNYVTQEVSCAYCEAEWIDQYTLTGYALIRSDIEPEKTA